jgi:hypothetical protein
VENLELKYESLSKCWVSHVAVMSIINVLGVVSYTSTFLSDVFKARILFELKSFPEFDSDLNNMKDLVLEKRELREKVYPNFVCIIPKFEYNSKIPL